LQKPAHGSDANKAVACDVEVSVKVRLVTIAASCLAAAVPTAAGTEDVLRNEARLIRITVTPRIDEARPVAGNGYFAWAQNSVRHPRHYDTFVRGGRGRPIRVNARGTNARPGAISGHTLVYDERGRGVAGGSDIRLFDLRRKRRYDPPRGVNTPAHELDASISGRWLVFRRTTGEYGQWFARDLVTGTNYDLFRGTPFEGIRCPGLRSFGLGDRRFGWSQVNGRFAVFQCYSPRRHDLVQRRGCWVGNDPIFQFAHRAPSVTPEGAVYFARLDLSGRRPGGLYRQPYDERGCASGGARVRAAARAAVYEEVLALPRGEVIRSTYVSGNFVYFDRKRSRDAPADIYRIGR